MTSIGLRVLAGKARKCWRIWLVQTFPLMVPPQRQAPVQSAGTATGAGAARRGLGAAIHRICCRESRSGPCMGLAGGTGSRKGAGFSPTGSRPPSLGCSVGGSPATPPVVLQPACHPPASPAAGPELGGGEQDTLSRSQPCPQEAHNWTTC